MTGPGAQARVEKKRLDLEKELYEYNQSDKYRVKLKYVKLKKYLKEICESEKRAHTRNQEYLNQFERVQAHVGHFTTSTEKLQELKIEYETQIKKMQLFSKDSLGIEDELKDEGREKIAVPAGINSSTSMSRGLYQPATIFMGLQMSTLSSFGDFSTEQESAQPTKNFSIPNPHSYRQTAPSSRVTDSCVVQTPSDMQCLTKSDKVDGKTSLQNGEKTPVTAQALSEEEQTHCLEIGSSPRHSESNLSEGRKSAELHSLPQQRLNPKNRTSDLKCDSCSRSEGSEGERLTQEHIEVEEESANLPVSALSVSKHCTSENKRSPEMCSAGAASPGLLTHRDTESCRPLEHVQEKQEEGSRSSSSSSLTVSISEDDLILESPEPQPNLGAHMEGEGVIQAFTLIHAEQEGVLATGKNDGVLQTLSSLDSKKASCTTSPRQSEQAPDLSFHSAPSVQPAASLKKLSQSLHKETAAALSKGLPAECEARSAIHSDESSCSMPSILQEGTGIKEAKPAFRLSSLRMRDQEEDESEQESMCAKVPVTETKAYQLLKKSTLQEHTDQMEDGRRGAHASVAQFSGLNTGSSALQMKAAHEVASEATFSSCKGSPLSRHEDKKKSVTHLKSNAFWGESDDSNSDIEAALRPRNQDASSDDFDDFYN
ncbi:PREDICTED: centrosomal protein kizuna isoform X2 [Chinchilla lanigera]|uniref:centrosomal protein kizuna isoform X2 n=1 Tax=Chinchilla lanigera TaxID=34839 RepID=UPI00038EF9EA|nr:PREDICTED: centrosomal protein kizuna isoform X2 [Chinchilla lanigera]